MTTAKSSITCHVLDSTLGRPARGVQLHLERMTASSTAGAESLARGQTDDDGRCTTLLDPSTRLASGVYKMTFETGAYFAADQRETFYPRVEILFNLPEQPDAHYHIPLLLSPYSYTTYRGS